MESKIYSREEIEGLLNKGHVNDFLKAAPFIIRQLLQQNQELQAKVDEAAKIEELLKEIMTPLPDFFGETIDSDDSSLHYNGKQFFIAPFDYEEGMMMPHYDRLVDALTSLVGGGK